MSEDPVATVTSLLARMPEIGFLEVVQRGHLTLPLETITVRVVDLAIDLLLSPEIAAELCPVAAGGEC